MQIIAIHNITNPQQFWDRAAEGTQSLPDGVALQSVAPSQDGMRAICLWDAESQDRVREVVENMVGEFSTNEYYPVDSVNAVGLPSGS